MNDLNMIKIWQKNTNHLSIIDKQSCQTPALNAMEEYANKKI